MCTFMPLPALDRKLFCCKQRPHDHISFIAPRALLKRRAMHARKGSVRMDSDADSEPVTPVQLLLVISKEFS